MIGPFADTLTGAQVFVLFLLGMLLGAVLVDRVWAPVRKALHAHQVARLAGRAAAATPVAAVSPAARRAAPTVPLVRVQIHRCGGLPFCVHCRRN